MKWSFVKSRRIFVLLGIFSLAMGILEAIVVVYLRAIYYPQGFEFPLSSISPQMLYVEFLREIATIIMLVTLAAIAGKNSLQKLSYFLYSFAIWDISYYVWLKRLLNWPPSFLTWDLLFLIPCRLDSPGTCSHSLFSNHDTACRMLRLFTRKRICSKNKIP